MTEIKHICTQESRMERIESKVDKIFEAVVELKVGLGILGASHKGSDAKIFELESEVKTLESETSTLKLEVKELKTKLLTQEKEKIAYQKRFKKNLAVAVAAASGLATALPYIISIIKHIATN